MTALNSMLLYDVMFLPYLGAITICFNLINGTDMCYYVCLLSTENYGLRAYVSFRVVPLTAQQRHMTKDDRLLVDKRFLRGQRLNGVI